METRYHIERQGKVVHVYTYTEGDMLGKYLRNKHPVVDAVAINDHLVLQSPYNHAVLAVLHTPAELVAWLQRQQRVPADVADRVALLCKRAWG